jgi:hypothetical protein
MKRLIEALYTALAKLPTTNARIAVTLVLAMGTGVKYWVSNDWRPDWDWLAFLAMMSGLDAAQFYGKRKTHMNNAKG